MTIAIDYDNTFTRDPEFFLALQKLAEKHQHKCVIVTGRDRSGMLGKQAVDALNGNFPIVFAGKQWKRDAAKAHGWLPDIWIDDMPEHVGPQGLVSR